MIASSLEKAQEDPLRAELWFYLVALGGSEGRKEALTELAILIDKGARSPGWDFSRILDRARSQEEPDLEWLDRLAAVISGRAGPEALHGWPEWPTQ